MTECQVGQCGCGLSCGLCQRLLQSSEGYIPHRAEQQIQPPFQQIIYVQRPPVFAPAIDDAHPLVGRFVLAKPSVSYPRQSSSGLRQYDRFASIRLGLAKKLLPSGGEYTLNCFVQEKHANSLLYEPKALAWKFFHIVHGVLSFCLAYLTSLIVHYRGCSLSSAHQYLVFQSKVRSFGSPVGGL